MSYCVYITQGLEYKPLYFNGFMFLFSVFSIWKSRCGYFQEKFTAQKEVKG